MFQIRRGVVANITGLFTLCWRQRLKLKVLYKLNEGSTSLVIFKRLWRISAGLHENTFWDFVNLLHAVSFREFSPQKCFPLKKS